MQLLIVGFVFLAAPSEATVVVTRERSKGVEVSHLLRPEMNTVSIETPVYEFIDRLLRERRTEHIVVDREVTVREVVTFSDVRSLPDTIDPDTRVNEIVTIDPPTVSATADAFDLFRALGEANTDCVLIEEAGRVLGLVSRQDFVKTLTLLEGSEQTEGVSASG